MHMRVLRWGFTVWKCWRNKYIYFIQVFFFYTKTVDYPKLRLTEVRLPEGVYGTSDNRIIFFHLLFLT